MKEEHIKCEHHHERDIVSSSSFKERHIERKEKKTTTKKKTHKKQTRSSKIEMIGFSLTSPLGTGLSSGARKTCTVARCLYLSSTLDSTESLNLRLCSSSRLPRRLRPPPRLRVQEWTGRDLLGLARRACTRPCGTAPRGLFSRALRPSAAGRR